MDPNTKQFHYTNKWVKVKNQIVVIYNIITTGFWLVNQENDLGHCLHIKFQITAIFTFVDISTDGYYVALNSSNVRFLTFNDHLKYHEINSIKNLTINNKISKNVNFAPYKC